ncbi:hypothetical protein D5085_04975 [Ectothiorhodospiraceae bacterium BW-2]|nr:hypothetical protein D5085_04975 [Ectothiorhodospiraceae bacterium BW-2]
MRVTLSIKILALWLLSVTAVASTLPEALLEQSRTYQQQLAERYAQTDIDDPMRLQQSLQSLIRHSGGVAYDVRQPLELALTSLPPPRGELWLHLSYQPFTSEERAERQPLYAAMLAWLSEQQAGYPQSPIAVDALKRAVDLAVEQEEYATAIALQQPLLEADNTPEQQQRLQQLRQQRRQQQSLQLIEANDAVIDNRAYHCLLFNAPLSEREASRYREQMTLEPAHASWQLRYRYPWQRQQLCLGGLIGGVDYQLTLAAGVRSETGERALWQPLTYQWHHPVEPDPEPYFSFESDKRLLPASGAQVVPLQHRYSDRVRLALLRIDPRNLAHERVRAYLLDSELNDYQAWQVAHELGEVVWRGEMALQRSETQPLTEYLPLPQQQTTKPGLYLLLAGSEPPPEYSISWCEGERLCFEPRASQWLFISDIGLSSYHSERELTLISRDLNSGESVADLPLQLLAKNNSVLFEGRSDSYGRVDIPAHYLQGEGGSEPKLILAWQNPRHFTLLNLEQRPYDMAGNGVGGRLLLGPLDLWLQSERGVYRPGEAVEVIGLLRNRRGEVVSDLPLYFVLQDAADRDIESRYIHPEAGGSYRFTLSLPPQGRTGSWLLQARTLPEEAPLAEWRFEVQEIEPPRLKADFIAPPQRSLATGEEIELSLQADYLFGAAAADLRIASRAVIRSRTTPFAEFRQFQFGLPEPSQQQPWQSLAEGRTDSRGAAKVSYRAPERLDGFRPAEATIYSRVIDVDGRDVAISTSLPLHHYPAYLGLRVESAAVEAGEAVVGVVRVDINGQAVAAAGLQWRLYRRQWQEQWYERNGRWQLQWQEQRQLEQQGELNIAAPEVTQLRLSQLQGESYRLELSDPASGVTSALHFGRYSGSGGEPEQGKLLLRSDKQHYLPGERAQITVQSPFEGQGSLLIATDEIVDHINFELGTEPVTLSIPVVSGWGVGANLLLTAVAGAERGGDSRRLPQRLMANLWLDSGRTVAELPLQLQVAAQVEPESPLTVLLQPTGATEPLHAVLLAVDEAVLRLTGFEAPQPLEHFFSQRQLGMVLRDNYSAIIDTTADYSLATVRHGYAMMRAVMAEAAGQRGRAPNLTDIVALASGVVTLPADGGEITLQLPDFSGELRLMALVWSGNRLGSAVQAVTVSPPLLFAPTAPRQLASGDQSQLTLRLHNLRAPAAEYQLKWQGDGVAFEGERPSRVSLAEGESRILKIPFRAKEVGQAEIVLQLQGEGVALERRLPLQIVAPTAYQLQRQLHQLLPQESLTVEPSLAELHGAKVTIEVSTNPLGGVGRLLQQLQRYPYGCLEQLSSRAWPLLLYPELQQRLALAPLSQRTEALQPLWSQLWQRQNRYGGFGMWSSEAEERRWLSVYATDMLLQAETMGYLTDSEPLQRARARLYDYLGSRTPGEEGVQSYALYLLARRGELERRWLTSLAESIAASPEVDSPTLALLAAAFYQHGAPERATELFKQAEQRLREPGRSRGFTPYGSPLRDALLLLYLLAESDQPLLLEPLLQQVVDQLQRDGEHLSTQELAWLARGVAKLPLSVQAWRLQHNGETIELGAAEGWRWQGEGEAVAVAQQLQNRSEVTLWVSSTLEGAPKLPLSIDNDASYQISQGYYRLDGEAVTPATPLQQGELLVGLITLQAKALSQPTETLVIDRIAAGLALENSALLHRLSVSQLDWLPDLVPLDYQEWLEDRYLAALTLLPDDGSRRLAYLVRVVSPGRYTDPAVEVEAMFQPYRQGRGELRQWQIIE